MICCGFEHDRFLVHANAGPAANPYIRLLRLSNAFESKISLEFERCFDLDWVYYWPSWFNEQDSTRPLQCEYEWKRFEDGLPPPPDVGMMVLVIFEKTHFGTRANGQRTRQAGLQNHRCSLSVVPK